MLGHRLRRAGTGVSPLAFVGSYSLGTDTTGQRTISLTGLTGGLASAPAPNDIVVAAFAASHPSTAQTLDSGGWTTLTDVFADDTNDCRLLVAHKVMGGSPDTSVLWHPTASTTNAAAVALHVWRNINATPMDATATAANGINTFFPNPPAITPVTPGAIVLVVGAQGHGRGTSTMTHAGLTKLKSVGMNGSANDVSLAIGAYESWASGSYDPAAFTSPDTDSTNFAWAALTIALRPQ